MKHSVGLIHHSRYGMYWVKSSLHEVQVGRHVVASLNEPLSSRLDRILDHRDTRLYRVRTRPYKSVVLRGVVAKVY